MKWTSTRGRGWAKVDMGEGVKTCQNSVDVIYHAPKERAQHSMSAELI